MAIRESRIKVLSRGIIRARRCGNTLRAGRLGWALLTRLHAEGVSAFCAQAELATVFELAHE